MKHRHQLSPVPEECLQFGIRNPSQLATGKSRFSSESWKYLKYYRLLACNSCNKSPKKQRYGRDFTDKLHVSRIWNGMLFLIRSPHSLSSSGVGLIWKLAASDSSPFENFSWKLNFGWPKGPWWLELRNGKEDHNSCREGKNNARKTQTKNRNNESGCFWI